MPSMVASELSAVLLLNHDLAEARRARRQIRATLRGWGLHDCTDLAELLTSELVSNALQHGAGPIGVRLSYGRGDLCVEVHDDGPGRPVRREAAEDDEYGRGLVLVDGLLGIHGGRRGIREDQDGPGKTVYVVLALGEGAGPQAAPAGLWDADNTGGTADNSSRLWWAGVGRKA